MIKRFVHAGVSIAVIGAMMFAAPKAVLATYANLWVATAGSASAPGSSCANPGYVGATDEAIQAAVDDASEGAVVHICAGVYAIDTVIDLHSVEMTLRGADRETTVLDGGNTFTGEESDDNGSQIVFSDGHATVESLTFQHGYSNGQWGGAVHVEYLTILDSIFVGNYADVPGGAAHGATVHVESSDFSDNHSTGNGGAISAWDGLEILGSTLVGNTSEDDGGAVYARSSLVVHDSDIDGNTSEGAGGAFAVESASSVDIDFVSMSDNQSTEEFGGAVYVSAPGAEITIRNSDFSENAASWYGGALNIWAYGGRVSIQSSIFTENSAGRYGGAINAWSDLNVVNNSFVGNFTAEDHNGGGAAIGTGTAEYPEGTSSVTILRNRFSSNSSAGSGGAVLIEYDIRPSNSVRVSANQFKRNSADVSGGGVQIDSCQRSYLGGSVFRIAEGNQFVANRAGGRGSKVSGRIISCD